MKMRSNNKRRNSFSTDESIEMEEIKVNKEITTLIEQISLLSAKNNMLICSIKSPKLLIRGLTELRDMVEMIDIKYSIINQIKFLITNEARKKISDDLQDITNFEGHMLHSVISGNPGTGKTTVAMILAKIWMALGFINKGSNTPKLPKTKNTDSSSKITLPSLLGSIINLNQQHKILELDEANKSLISRLKDVEILALDQHNTFIELRRSILKLKNKFDEENDDTEQDFELILSLSRNLRFGFDDLLQKLNSDKVNLNEATVIHVNNTLNLNTNVDIHFTSEDPYEKTDPKFTIACREDLIAEYLGQTAPKTKEVLEKAVGGVLFIDEAYSLCNTDNGSKDKYGDECLSTINEFMSLHPDEIIIIFAGYKDKIENNLFKQQPGLKRRINSYFEIKDYSSLGLSKIFKKQLAKSKWILAPDIDIKSIISENTDLITGGGTEKLVFQSKIAYAKCKFDETIKSIEDANSNTNLHDSIITKNMLTMAISELRKNHKFYQDDAPPDHMYM